MAADVSASADTGLGRHQWFLARQLARHGFQVHELYEDAVPTGSWRPARRFRFPRVVLREVRDAARRGQPYDVALVHEGSSALLCFARMRRAVPTLCVTVSHNPEQKVWELSREYARRGLHTISTTSRLIWPATRLWQSNFGLRHSDHVLCLSEEDREWISRRFSLPLERISRITNGVEPACLLPARPPGPPRILFLGTWIPPKGTAELRNALGCILERHADARVSLIGTGLPEELVLNEFASSLHSRIDVRARFTPSQLPEILSRHNLFVLPSWWEGMPLSLLEAMGAGLAPVVAGVGGVRDVLRDNVDGLMTPPGNAAELTTALDRLCADQDLRARLGAAAGERAQRYTWARAGEGLAQILRRLIDGGVSSQVDVPVVRDAQATVSQP